MSAMETQKQRHPGDAEMILQETQTFQEQQRHPGDAEMSAMETQQHHPGDAEMNPLNETMREEQRKEPLLVSACLLGEAVRYDGRDNQVDAVLALADRYTLVPFCPEVEGGLPIPRIPAEIVHGRVRNRAGEDVTAAFQKGAEAALALCRREGITRAVLKSRSPSCGKSRIYDGTFQGVLKDGQGVAAALLENAGVTLYDEEDCEEMLP